MNNLNQATALQKLSKNLTVLYVEDDSMLRTSTAALFEDLFKEVHLAVDGMDGVELYKKYYLDNLHYYDIVITDINMPNLSGIDMSKAILEINKEQKIIVISAHDEKDFLIDAINIGVDGFLQKPLSIGHLVEVLNKTCMTFYLDDLQYFKALTEASIVSKTDTDGIITYANDNFCNITGYSCEEMLGQSHRMFRHPDTPASIYKELWDTITAGKIWRNRIVNLNKDGTDFISETTIIPLIVENGKIKEYMAIRNDVTDLVNYRREIIAKEQEKKRNDKVAEAQKSFLVIFTHELKTPLNAIINFTKYVKKQIESPKELNKEKLSDLLESVLNNAQDMLENITEILEMSKLKAGKLNYHYNIFSPNTLIGDILKKFDSLIAEKNINIKYDITQETFINSDEKRVKQIFSNILSNAIKYGNDEIIIKLLDDNEKTMISVEDNGLGVKDKEAIFDLYAQEDENILQRKGKGTGIGLHFIKLLCQDLNIGYKIEDRDKGLGTKFTLIFKNKTKKLTKV